MLINCSSTDQKEKKKNQQTTKHTNPQDLVRPENWENKRFQAHSGVAQQTLQSFLLSYSPAFGESRAHVSEILAYHQHCCSLQMSPLAAPMAACVQHATSLTTKWSTSQNWCSWRKQLSEALSHPLSPECLGVGPAGTGYMVTPSHQHTCKSPNFLEISLDIVIITFLWIR